MRVSIHLTDKEGGHMLGIGGRRHGERRVLENTSQNPCYNRGNNGEVFEGRECLGLKDSEDDV